MRVIWKLLSACLVIGSLGMSAPLQAADNKLPNLNPGRQATGSAVAQAALKKDAVCTRCHDESETAPVLSIYQTRHGVRGDSRTPTCQSCHGQAPHKKEAKLNTHTSKIACQTCHIPAFARGDVPTKMEWDWSTAGKRGPDGKPFCSPHARG